MARYRKDYRSLRRDPYVPSPEPEHRDGRAAPQSAAPQSTTPQPLTPQPVRSAPPSPAPLPQPAGERALSCPVCGARLAAFAADGYYAHCPGCRRVWFEGTLFRLHLQQVRPSLRPEDVSSALLLSAGDELPGTACPAGSHGPLRSASWEGAPLAVCTACESVLLEADALADLERRNRAALRRDRADYLTDAMRYLFG